MSAPRIDIGIKEPDRRKIANGLGRLLADTYTLYLKTHNFHWNVTGPMFQTLHVMFEEQYTEQWQAADLIAERIRALGFPAPGTFKEFLATTSIKEPEGTPSAENMIRELVDGQEAVVRTARAIVRAQARAQRSVTPWRGRDRTMTLAVACLSRATRRPRRHHEPLAHHRPLHRRPRRLRLRATRARSAHGSSRSRPAPWPRWPRGAPRPARTHSAGPR